MRIYVSIVIFLLLFSSQRTMADFNPDEGKVYGRLNISYQYEDNLHDDTVWKLASNASRLGFKGQAELENKSTVIYQIEYGVEADDGDKNGRTITQRDAYLGIKSSWGTLKAGRLTIPFKDAKGDFDYFNDLPGELGKVVEGEDRLSNVIMYETAWGLANNNDKPAVNFAIAFIPGEDAEHYNHPSDSYSASLSYHSNQWYLALAVNNNIEQQNLLRLVASYKINSMQFGALYQYGKLHHGDVLYPNNKKRAHAFGVSASYRFGKNKFKAQSVDNDATLQFSNARHFSIAVDHQWAKKTTLYSYLSRRKTHESDQQFFIVGVGLVHKF